MKPMFTEDATRAIKYAREEACNHGHDYIGSEHILLALMRLDQGRPIQVLTKLGLDLNELKTRIEDEMSPSAGGSPLEQLPLTGRAKHVLELAALQARVRKKEDIDAEDLLLSLVKCEVTLVAKVLIEFAVDYDKELNELTHL